MERLRRLIGRPVLLIPEELPPPADAKTGSAAATPEEWLAGLLGRLIDGGAAAVAELEGAALDGRIATLERDSHARLAAEWLEKLVTAAPPGAAADALRARAARIYLDRGEGDRAIVLLEQLAHSAGPRAADAHFQLGEYHQRQGDRRAALRHFEAVLALDLDYPNARVRAATLRAALGPVPVGAAAAVTIAGIDGHVATTGARYRLVAELGRGASGAVYRAHDMELDRDVAIKLLHPHLAAAMGRFFAEARVAAALRHPSIVGVLDLDEDQRRIVMELCTGGTLRERLRSGPLPAAQSLAYHADMLSALAAAHRRDVVHRDLKPANLLLREPEGEIVLVDFGVAHLGGRASVDRGPVEPVGTLLYMAPEQRRGEATPASDVWAAGIILHELLTGRAPAGLTAAAPELPASAVPPSLAGPLAQHLAALTAARPADRPSAAAAEQIARDLVDRALSS